MPLRCAALRFSASTWALKAAHVHHAVDCLPRRRLNLLQWNRRQIELIVALSSGSLGDGTRQHWSLLREGRRVLIGVITIATVLSHARRVTCLATLQRRTKMAGPATTQIIGRVGFTAQCGRYTQSGGAPKSDESEA
jgi:hypothetical protein